MPIDIGGALAGIGSFSGNMISSSINASRSWKYTRKAMALQDKYQRNLIRDYYGLNRESLTSAGYNPLLAIPGSTAQAGSFSPTTFNSDSDVGDQAVNSAMTAMSLKSNIENTKSQTKVNEANSSLAEEQAKTEESKRSNLEFDNMLKETQARMNDKNLEWYDRRANAELYELGMRAKLHQASSAIGAINAETARQDMINRYNLGKYHNESERMNSYTNSKNARINQYNADTNRGRRSIGVGKFSATWTPRNY